MRGEFAARRTRVTPLTMASLALPETLIRGVSAASHRCSHLGGMCMFNAVRAGRRRAQRRRQAVQIAAQSLNLHPTGVGAGAGLGAGGSFSFCRTILLTSCLVRVSRGSTHRTPARAPVQECFAAR